MKSDPATKADIDLAVSELRSEMGEIRSDVNGLRSDVNGLRSDVNELRSGMDDLGRRIEEQGKTFSAELARQFSAVLDLGAHLVRRAR